jgi:hypothetical protein
MYCKFWTWLKTTRKLVALQKIYITYRIMEKNGSIDLKEVFPDKCRIMYHVKIKLFSKKSLAIINLRAIKLPFKSMHSLSVLRFLWTPVILSRT